MAVDYDVLEAEGAVDYDVVEPEFAPVADYDVLEPEEETPSLRPVLPTPEAAALSFEKPQELPTDTLREATWRERLRMSPTWQKIAGPTAEEVHYRRERGMPVPVTPGGLIERGFEMPTLPPPVANLIREVTDPLIAKLPRIPAGLAAGTREFALAFPAPLAKISFGKNLGKVVMGLFSGQFAFQLPDALEQFDAARSRGDTKGATEIATQQALLGAVLGAGGLAEVARFKKPGVPNALPIQKAAAVPFRETPGGGPEVGRQVRGPEEPPGAIPATPVRPPGTAPGGGGKAPEATEVPLKPAPKGAFEEVVGWEGVPGIAQDRWFTIKKGKYPSPERTGIFYVPGNGVTETQMKMLGFKPPKPVKGASLRTQAEVEAEVKAGLQAQPAAPAWVEEPVRVELKRRGFTDEQIGEMTGAEADVAIARARRVEADRDFVETLDRFSEPERAEMAKTLAAAKTKDAAELKGRWVAANEVRKPAEPVAPAPIVPGVASSEVVAKIPPLSTPKGWRLVVGRTRRKEGHTYEAAVDWQRKEIVFSSQRHLENPEIRNHEIAHVLIETLPKTHKKTLFDAYIDLKSQTPKWKKFGKEWIVKNNFHREEIAIEAGDYFTHPERLSPALRALFKKHLAQPVHPAPAVAKAAAAAPAAPEAAPTAESIAQKVAKGDTKLTSAERIVMANMDEAAATAYRTRLAELRAAPAEATTVSKPAPFIQLAEAVVVRMEDAAAAAAARLKDRMKRLSVGVDPTIISDLVIIGSAKFARGVVEFAKWSEAMLKEFGEEVRPYLQQTYEASKQQFEAIRSAAAEVRPASESVPLEVKPTPVEAAAGLSLGPGARSPLKQRKFHGRFKNTDEIQLETRSAVRNEFYSPRSHSEVNRAVNTMLEHDGIETMIRRLMQDDPTLPPDHKVAAQLNIMKRLNQQAIDLDAAGETGKANYVRDRQVELIDTLADRNATEMGRAVSAYQMWNALTPEGILRDYKHKVGLIRDKALASIDQGLRGVVETVRSDGFKSADMPAQRRMLLDAFKGLGRASKSVVGKVKVLMDAAKDPKLFDEALIREVTEALKLPKLDEAFSRDLLRRAQEAMKKPEGFQRDFALSKLAGEIRNKVGISLREVATSWWYASILSGPPTQFVNVAAGLVRVVTDLSLLGASHPRALAQMFKGYFQGSAQGWREAVAIIKEGDYSRRESNLFEPTVLEILSDSPSSLKRALSYGKYVGRTMTAADMVNFKGASEAFSRLKAWEQARKEGLKGEALQKRVDEILHTSWEDVTRAKDQARAEGVTGNNLQRRVDEIIQQQRDAGLNEESRQFGLEATYNQEPTGGIGEIVKALSGMKRSQGPLGVVSTFIVPFTRIVGNVFSEFLNWTPYGYMRLFRMAEKGSKSTDAFRMQAMKATLGTAAVPALYTIIKATEDEQGNAWFDINGPGPNDADLRKSMMQTGWRQNSVKIGDVNIRFMNTPFAMPFAFVGYFRDAGKYEKMDQKEVLDRFAFTMFYAGRSVFDVSFLTGLGDFFEGLSTPQGAKKIANMMQRTATGFVSPNLIKWLDRVWDPTVTKADTLKERFIRDFPIARSYLGKPMLNLLGEPIVHEGSARFSWDRFWTIHKPDPIWDLFTTKHVSPHMPSKSILIYGKPITPEQYYRLVQERGKILRGIITEWLPDLQKMDSEELQDGLGQMSRSATQEAKDIVASQIYEPR